MIKKNILKLIMWKRQRMLNGAFLKSLSIYVYVYHKYSDTLNTFNMLCPLNKAKVIFKGSSQN